VNSGKRILLIAGGSRGIGAATARLAAAQGYDVAVNYVRDEAAASAVVRAAQDAGSQAIAVQGDMAKEEDVSRLFEAVETGLGPLTHFVYSAGITGGESRLDSVETATMRAVLDLNVLGALFCLRAAVRRMSTKHGGQGGSIVLLSSAAATLGAPNEYVWYAASKGAIDSMTIGLAQEIAREGIRVNAVAPGAIDTEIHSPGRLERIAPRIPIGRVGTAEEVAEAILFLLSDAAAYITGTVLRVSGAR
jgi:NAD(P)-dependent dehydrogenase (short-subunit alcohol dehydrogenase family)